MGSTKDVFQDISTSLSIIKLARKNSKNIIGIFEFFELAIEGTRQLIIIFCILEIQTESFEK